MRHKILATVTGMIWGIKSALEGIRLVSIPEPVRSESQELEQKGREFITMDHREYFKTVLDTTYVEERYTYPAWDEVQGSIRSSNKLQGCNWTMPNYKGNMTV